jgi:hypothetical protein
MSKTKPPNPIYERFTRGSRWPSMRRTRWLPVVGGVLACAVLAGWLISVRIYYWLFDILTLPSGLAVISPVILSVYAVNLTYRLIQNSDYQMIRLTPLSEDEILQGFTQVALSRLRMLRVIITGIVLIVGLLLISESVRWNYPPVYVELIITAVMDIGCAVVVWIAQWACISFGVSLALQFSSRWWAMILTGVGSLFISAMLYLVGGYLILIMEYYLSKLML